MESSNEKVEVDVADKPTPGDVDVLIARRPQLQNSTIDFEYTSNGSIIDVHIKENELIAVKHNLTDLPNKIFPFHCMEYTDLRPESCKFKNRGCLCKTWNLKEPVTLEKYNSLCWYKSADPTVIPIPIDKHKNGVEIADTKLILCSNTECKRINTDSVIVPTTYHYCCYANMVHKDGIEHIKYCNKNMDFTSYQQEELKKMQSVIESNDIILPVCGKKCYNILLRKRQSYIDKEKKALEAKEKAKNEKESLSQSPLLRWDSDARDGSLTSEGVIVNWLTDQNNAEKYFGGNHGHNNSVNGTRKDAYHKSLSTKIMNENGRHRPPALVKNKIEHLLRSYKNANDIVMSSGQGLEDDEFDSFMEMIHCRHCKWYSTLDSVLSNRHNVQAAYTNEAYDSSSDHEESSDNPNEREEVMEPSCTSTSNNNQNSIDLMESEDDKVDGHTSSASSSAAQSRQKESPTKQPKTLKKNKLSYMEAASKRRLKKKSIAATNCNTSTTRDFNARTTEHFNRMYEVHREKMSKQAEIQRANIEFQDRKLTLEIQKMNCDSNIMRLQEEKLKGEIMKDITEHNFNMMKKRKEMMEMYPNISNEELNAILPLRELQSD